MVRRDIILAGNGGMADECWIWPYAATPAGYGTVYVAGKSVYTHRLSYEVHVGPVPHGLTLDHTCRQTLCWNPAHLEPVTKAENSRRQAEALRRTHCPQGHEYATSARPGRGNDCAVCHRAQERERGRRQRAEKMVASSHTTR